MSLTIKKGYLIARKDYDLFDEVLTFITDGGFKYIIFAPGVRKITSKNSRSLFYGNYLEFEFFQSRIENKMSKLKKVTTLSNIGYESNFHPSLNLISDILDKINDFNQEYFEFYQKILNYVILNINSSLIDIFIYLYFLCTKNIIKSFTFDTCKHTKLEQIGFDLKNKSFVCQKCLNLDTVLLNLETIDLFKQILLKHDTVEYKINIKDIDTIKSILKKIFNENRKFIYGK